MGHTNSVKVKEIKFYRASGIYGAFSNFSPHSVYIDSRIWPTSEHYFQAMKREDHLLQEEIRQAPTPSQAARLGRSRKHPLRPNWDKKYRDMVMLHALRCKFSQHPDLLEMLQGTGDAELIEHTSNDSYWGDGGDGSGENKLGKLLMEIRSYLTSADRYK